MYMWPGNGGGGGGVRGLVNLGSTCYLNAVLQVRVRLAPPTATATATTTASKTETWTRQALAAASSVAAPAGPAVGPVTAALAAVVQRTHPGQTACFRQPGNGARRVPRRE
jgi:hypothetical protein